MTGAMRAAAEGDARDKAKPRKPEDKACERGLAYLARVQKSDGSFPGTYSNVSCALASMAFMASGHFPGRGKYGDNLERAVLWLAGRPDERGYFGLDGGKMYGHGMCTLALAEAYGMLRTRLDNLKVRDSLEKAVNLVVACQGKPNHGAANGAWRYEPRPGDADLSITCWIIQAIRLSTEGSMAGSAPQSIMPQIPHIPLPAAPSTDGGTAPARRPGSRPIRTDCTATARLHPES